MSKNSAIRRTVKIGGPHSRRWDKFRELLWRIEQLHGPVKSIVRSDDPWTFDMTFRANRSTIKFLD